MRIRLQSLVNSDLNCLVQHSLLCFSEMKIWIYSFVLAVSCLEVSSQTCPSDHFSAIFAATLDQTINTPTVNVPDPELNFFMNVLKFRYQDIIHFAEDAIYFFNETFGLDFTTSLPPNDQHELFYKNAKMGPYMFFDDSNYYVTSNSWLRTGSTRSTCYLMRNGGFQVTFSGEQTLYGSYGGAEGKLVGGIEALVYGFYIIDACQQSPIPYLPTLPGFPGVSRVPSVAPGLPIFTAKSPVYAQEH